MDIMRTRPMVIIGGSLYENPFFVGPDEFLRELRERRVTRTNSVAEVTLQWKLRRNGRPMRSNTSRRASTI
jgi:hypothetical protein